MKRTRFRPSHARARTKIGTGIRTFMLCCLLLFAATPIHATKEVSGTIFTDTIWNVENSPYIATGHIYVRGTDGPDGITTLTIEPGVQIRFNPGVFLSIGASSDSPGAVIARGTQSAPILFTSNQPTRAAGDWSGMVCYATTHASTIFDHSNVSSGDL